MMPRVRLVEEARRRPSEVFRKTAGSSPHASRAPRHGDLALVAVFLVLICLPLSGLMLGFDRTFILEENRNLAAWPAFKTDRAALAALPGKFEAYFNDHFGFRKRLIYWLAIVKVQGLGVTSTPGVTLGTNGWLYLASDSAVQSYRVVRPFTSGQLEAFRQLLEARRDWLAARGIPYLLVFAPNKDTIYPEFMPAAYNKLHPESRLDQLLDYMKDHSSVPIVDVREDLRRAKRVERVYDVTDSHWNSSGGYIAYERIMQALSAWFPEAQAAPRSEFRAVVENGPGGDLARMLGIADRIPEERLKLVPRTRWHFSHSDERFPIAARGAHPELTIATEWTDAKLPRAILFRDSFAAQLIPFLAEHFQRILCVWDRDFDRAIIEHERPGVVIQEVVERSLEAGMPVDR
jgi:alginate O-acetyltransferase complex protein AlgJ